MTERVLRYRAYLPQSVTVEDIERLRGLGYVRVVYEIEGSSRGQVIRDLVDENMGWHYALSDPNWWQENLSRGVHVHQS